MYEALTDYCSLVGTHMLEEEYAYNRGDDESSRIRELGRGLTREVDQHIKAWVSRCERWNTALLPLDGP
jgi:hypothetical protein